MQNLTTFWIYIRRRWLVVVFILLFVAAYLSSWSFRRELGLIHPMANLRYFYYGADQDAFSDQALYWFYYPVYRSNLGMQKLRHGERYDIHWSDEKDTIYPTPTELGFTDADSQ